MIPFGLSSLMTVSLPIARRTTKCLVPGATAIYLCNEGTGTALTDRSGNDYHGTFGAGAAAPTWSAEGLVFAGGQYVTLPKAVAAALTAGGTIQVITKPGADVTTDQCVVGLGNTTAPRIHVISGKARLIAPLTNTGYYLYSTADAVVANTWIDIAGGVTWGASMSVSIDGALDASAASNSGALGNTAVTIPYIGANHSAAGFFTGTVAAVLVYPRELTPAETLLNHTALAALVAPRGIDLKK